WMVSPANPSAVRPLSSHQRVPSFVNGPPPTPPSDVGWPGETAGAVDAVFTFFGSSWPSYAVIQGGDRSQPTSDQSVNKAVVQNLPPSSYTQGRVMPVVNQEYGYLKGNRDEMRRAAWAINVGGSYGSFGDMTGPDGAQPFFTGDWRDDP